MSSESIKLIHNLSKTQDKALDGKNLPYTSPKRKTKKSSDRINLGINNKYIPMEVKQSAENNLEMDTVFSKSYEPARSKLGAGYKAALHELKMQ